MNDGYRRHHGLLAPVEEGDSISTHPPLSEGLDMGQVVSWPWKESPMSSTSTGCN